MTTIRYAMTDDAVAEEIGRRLAELRIDKQVTQAELAEAIGIDRGRITRLESHGTGKLSTIIAVLRHLNRLDLLQDWLPEEPPQSPLKQLKAMKEGKRHKAGVRSRVRAANKQPKEPEDLEW